MTTQERIQQITHTPVMEKVQTYAPLVAIFMFASLVPHLQRAFMPLARSIVTRAQSWFAHQRHASGIEVNLPTPDDRKEA